MEGTEVMDAVSSKVKVKQEAGREASSQAHSYAKAALFELHDGEVWDLAERLDLAMKQIVRQYVEEIRRDA
jgi:hypothetical protein